MADRQIIFTGEMVRGILRQAFDQGLYPWQDWMQDVNPKTMTRRVMKLTGFQNIEATLLCECFTTSVVNGRLPVKILGKCPYGQRGDRLWVRETWRCEELDGSGLDGVRYRADDAFVEIENSREAAEAWMDANRVGHPWRPSIFLPRWASRIMLEVVNVGVERVQEISEADAVAEGVTLDAGWNRNPIVAYGALWDKINYKRGYGWFENPWVWVIEFKVLEVRHGQE